MSASHTSSSILSQGADVVGADPVTVNSCVGSWVTAWVITGTRALSGVGATGSGEVEGRAVAWLLGSIAG